MKFALSISGRGGNGTGGSSTILRAVFRAQSVTYRRLPSSYLAAVGAEVLERLRHLAAPQAEQLADRLEVLPVGRLVLPSQRTHVEPIDDERRVDQRKSTHSSSSGSSAR